MLEYLLKSGACLAIFLLFYKLVLERESIHTFKRYYLLGALVVSFVIPKIIFTEYVEVAAPITVPVSTDQPMTVFEPATVATDADMLNLPLLLWTIYGLGVVLFGFKFLKNLRAIIRRIRKNPRYRVNSITNVLLSDFIPPHTFFHYIFLNKKKFEAKEIPEPVLLHEETHARQMHSLDVLFVELLQVLFWFNPFIYVAKKAIKLNHEFLADQAVVAKGVEAATYQNILLTFSSRVNQPELVNSINYSSIKKRFTVMKKRTSKKAIFFRSLLLLPLLALMLYGFSETKVIEKESVGSNNLSQKTFNESNAEENIIIKIDRNGISLKEELVGLPELKKTVKKAQEDSKSKKVAITIVDNINASSTVEYLSRYFELHNIPVKVRRNKNLNTSQQKMISSIEDIKILINKKGQLLIKNQIVSLQELPAFLAKINSKLSKEEREKVVRAIIVLDENQSAPKNVVADVEGLLKAYGVATINIVGPENLPEPARNQDGASRELMAEYDKLAKHYNEMPRNRMKIKKKDVDRLGHIYSLMSEKQKADAAPFPDFPPMPASPKAPKAPKAVKAPKVKKGEKNDIPPPQPNLNNEEFAEKVIDDIIANQDPYDNLNKFYSKVPEGRIDKFTSLPLPPLAQRIKKRVYVNFPPTLPPEPQTPLDHIIEMAKMGATFYYEGNEIFSDKAIELIKNNKNLNIDSSDHKNEHPEVRISKDRIIIEK